MAEYAEQKRKPKSAAAEDINHIENLKFASEKSNSIESRNWDDKKMSPKPIQLLRVHVFFYRIHVVNFPRLVVLLYWLVSRAGWCYRTHQIILTTHKVSLGDIRKMKNVDGGKRKLSKTSFLKSNLILSRYYLMSCKYTVGFGQFTMIRVL